MKQKDIFLILVPSFILVVLWVIFSIYHNFVSSTISQPLTSQIRPIQGTFDMKEIEAIKQRQVIPPVYSLSGGNLEASNSSEIQVASSSGGGQ